MSTGSHIITFTIGPSYILQSHMDPFGYKPRLLILMVNHYLAVAFVAIGQHHQDASIHPL